MRAAGRITPAYAGKSVAITCRAWYPRDHPRVCGEKPLPVLLISGRGGSPPRMRGKGSDPGTLRTVRGITPAYAGKRACSRGTIQSSRDHPRVCGEKLPAGFEQNHVTGSPPRMRGKVRIGCFYQHPSRITPAYAGKSLLCADQQIRPWDHPRVCGEKNMVFRYEDEDAGSPPRMRGKVVAFNAEWLYNGITPAYAGKRLKRSHSIGHFSCILRLFHSVLHRASASGGSRAGPCAPPCLPAQNAVPV